METVVGILGLLTIVGIVWTLFNSKTQPAIAFIIWPTILALILICIGYISFDDLTVMIKSGFSSTSATAALFVFSVLYFGIMTDAGMFDVIINKLMKLVGKSVIGVTVMTTIIALIGHLDGGGASTFCIVVPSMKPVYDRMHMRRTTLLRVSVLAMGVLNLMPWAGPTMRAASVLGMEAGTLWKYILPIQIFGIVLALAHAVLAGWQEQKYLEKNGLLNAEAAEVHTEEAEAEVVEDPNADLKRPKLFWFNLLLTVAVIALLIWDQFPSYYPFMLGCVVALFVNYGFTAKAHKRLINLHAESALMMCSTLMGAAILMGVLTTSIGVDGKAISAKTMEIDPEATLSVVRCLANLVSSVLPAFLGKHIALVIGILSVPLALAFDTDSYFYGMLPVIIGIGAAFGVEALPIAVAMVVCRNCATFISPMVPATLLGVGLADVDIKDHIKASFLYVWAFSIICMIFAIIIGIMPL